MDKNSLEFKKGRLISKLESDLDSDSDESSVSQLDPIARYKTCTKNLDSDSVLTLSDDSNSNQSWYSNDGTIVLDSDSQQSISIIQPRQTRSFALEKRLTVTKTTAASLCDSDGAQSSDESIIIDLKENTNTVPIQQVSSSNITPENVENYKLKDHKRLVNKFLNETGQNESKKLINELDTQIKLIPKMDEIKYHQKEMMKRNKKILTYIQRQYVKRIMTLRMLKNAVVKDKKKIKLFSAVVNKTYALLIEHTIGKNSL